MKTLEQVLDVKHRVILVPMSDIGLACLLLGRARGNLPDDIEVLGVGVDMEKQRYLIKVRSASFAKVPEASPIPITEIYFKEVTA